MNDNMSAREKEIYLVIKEDTESKLSKDDLSHLGMNAIQVSDIIFKERSNISRVLNQLHRDNILIKINGRPTFFICWESLYNYSKQEYMPTYFTSLKDLIKYVTTEDYNEITGQDPLINLIGSGPFESLHKDINILKKSLLYPPNGLPIIISGNKGTGKRDLIKAIFSHSLSKGLYNDNDYFLFYDCKTDIKDSLDNIISKNWVNKRMLVLYNFEYLKESNLYLLYNILEQQVNYYKLSECRYKVQIILVSNKDINTVNYLEFLNIVPCVIETKDFHLLTVKERVAHVLRLLQIECNNIDKIIQVNKDVISFLAMSRYDHNMLTITRDIKRSITNSVIRDNNSEIIEIIVDDLPESIIENADDITTNLSQLTAIFDLLNLRIVNFNPLTTLSYLSKLQNQLEYNQKNMISNKKLEQISPQDHIFIKTKTLIKNALSNTYVPVLSEEEKSFYFNIHEILENFNFINDPKLFQGLIIYLRNIIRDNKDKYVLFNKDIMELEHYSEVSKIEILYRKLTGNNFYVSNYLIINNYIKQAESISINETVKIIFAMSDHDISKSLVSFSNTLSNRRIAYYMKNNIKDSHKDNFYNAEESVFNRGVIIVTDHELHKKDIAQFIDKQIEFRIINEVDIKKIQRIVINANESDFFVDDLIYIYDREDQIIGDDFKDKDSLLGIIENNILKENLVFLNPDKITSIGEHVFNNIINDLKIEYNSVLYIRFIVHIAFVVERVLQNESLSYSDTINYIKNNYKEFNIISRNLNDVNLKFGIKIPQNEVVYICKIFLEDNPSLSLD